MPSESVSLTILISGRIGVVSELFLGQQFASVVCIYMQLYYLLEKYPTLFCENLVDFNEVRLHETTLNLHTNT